MCKREEFEKWAITQKFVIDRADDEYESAETRLAWKIWQAVLSRVLTIPEGYCIAPLRTTYKMKKAALAWEGCSDSIKYEAMIAARPKHITEQTEEVQNVR